MCAMEREQEEEEEVNERRNEREILSTISKYQLMNSIPTYDMGKIQSLMLLDCISNVGLGWFLAN